MKKTSDTCIINFRVQNLNFFVYMYYIYSTVRQGIQREEGIPSPDVSKYSFSGWFSNQCWIEWFTTSLRLYSYCFIYRLQYLNAWWGISIIWCRIKFKMFIMFLLIVNGVVFVIRMFIKCLRRNTYLKSLSNRIEICA